MKKKETKPRQDTIANVPLINLSFILRNVLPVARVLDNSVLSRAHIIDENDTYAEPKKRTLILTGSSIEGFALPSYYPAPFNRSLIPMISADVDKMEVIDYIIVDRKGENHRAAESKSIVVIDSNDVHPGFLRLEVPHQTGGILIKEDWCVVIVPVGDKRYLSPSLMLKRFFVNVVTAFTGETLPHSRKDVEELYILYKKKFPYFCCTGPSLAVDFGESVKSDNVAALQIPWPEEADEWKCRKRPSGWPSSEMVQIITSGRCHIVGTAHALSLKPEIEWRFSFSCPERTLAKSLNGVQRQCFILLKAIHSEVFDLPRKVITSYHLKTIFFWFLEKCPMAHSKSVSVGPLFLLLLDELLHHLIKHKIPSYFIPENNMLDHVHRNFIQDMIWRVAAVRKDPLKYLFQFNHRKQFEFSPPLPWEEIFKPVLRMHVSVEHCYRSHLESLYASLSAYITLIPVEDFRYPKPEATDLYRILGDIAAEMVAVRKQLGEQSTPLHCLSDAALAFSAPIPVSLLVFIMTSVDVRAPLLGFACKEKLDEFKKVVDEAFGLINGEPNYGCERLEYGRFLYNLGHHKEAEEPLLKVIREESLETLSCYREMGHESLDEDVKRVSNRSLEHVNTVSFAFYTLIKVYYRMGETAKATAMVEQFKEACWSRVITPQSSNVVQYNIYSRKGNKHAWKLYLFCCELLGDAQGAKLAESKIQEAAKAVSRFFSDPNVRVTERGSEVFFTFVSDS